MRIFQLKYIPFKLSYLFMSVLYIVLAACSKDANLLPEQEDSVADAIEETTEDNTGGDSANDDTTNDDSSDNTDSTTPGLIVFEEGFTLDETRSVVNYVLSPSDYNQFLEGEGNISMVTEKAYQYLKDDFDYVIILSVEAIKPPDLFYGISRLVQNQVRGLGSNTYDNSAAYGSDGQLKSIIYMPRTEYISNGPFLHEIAHSWANKGIIPSTVGGHWGFASTAGQLGGFGEIEALGNNTYQGKLNGLNSFGTFANGGNSIVFGNLELYAMGFIGADALESVQVAVNPEWGQNQGEFTADAIETYDAQDIIATHGERIPSVENSQKSFKALTVVISTVAISQEKIDEVSLNLENFSRQGNPDASWGGLKNFWLATQQKATFDFTVTQESIK